MGINRTIINWGDYVFPNHLWQTIVFPKSFTTEYTIIGSISRIVGPSDQVATTILTFDRYESTLSSCRMGLQGAGVSWECSWLAIGF